MRNISAVIVTFNPNVSVLSNLVISLESQVDNILIVDNASKNSEEIKSVFDNEAIVFLPENYGIAYAQNIGIKEAEKIGSRSVIFFDQDSQPRHDILQGLISAKLEAEITGVKVSVVGPFYCDSRTGTYSSYVKTVGKNTVKISKVNEHVKSTRFHECDFIISSGSLIDLEVLSIVGTMDEKLFIDMVDIEWCYRASSLGYNAIVASNVIMPHTIGSHVIKIFGKEYPVNSPVRTYYSLRNMFYLMFLPYIPTVWKRKYLSKLIIFAGFSIFIYPKKQQRIKAAFWSFSDFILGKYGRYNHKL
ncbi:MAG: glycosyltransferase family 2 protein [Vibrio ordalii]|uniref:glycosyltransferase family 2 protein n=1 Tax=Vibrio ordalii TaxID=28174 RepID=UPI003F3AC0F1